VKSWTPIIVAVAAIIGLAVTFGVIRPASQTQTVEAAKEIQQELTVRISKEEDERKADVQANIKEHKEIIGAIKDVSDRTYQMQIRILERFDRIDNAPTGTVFRRGVREPQ
jgi:hypothetical protein